LKAIPAEHPTTDHGHASSHLLARSLVTYSNERYEDRILPFGTPDDALDCAAGLYLGNPPDRRPPKDQRGAALVSALHVHCVFVTKYRRGVLEADTLLVTG